MSSILRALKKLESDSRHREGNRSLDNKFVPLADTGPQRSAFTFATMAGTGIICGLVVLAGWYFLAGRLQPQPSEHLTPLSPTAEQSPTALAPPEDISDRLQLLSSESGPPPSPAVKQEPAASVPTPDLKAGTDKTDVEPPEKVSLPDPVAMVPTTGPAVETPETGLDAGLAESTDQEAAPPETIVPPAQLPLEKADSAMNAPPLTETDRVPEPADSAVVPEAETSESRLTSAVKQEIPKLNNSDMKLQAITWSKIPQNRIAVVNNRIVREGESVSGYLIRTINQDDIVLSRDDEAWRLIFRIR